jgi:Putative redox-active protein (C_GCAxxG_C_C)
MEKKLDRRKMVALLGGLAGAGAAASLVARADQVVPAPASPMQKVPWPYKPIDPEAAAQRAFEGYYKAECMCGTFEAVVAPVGEQLGAPYRDFPFLMMRYGAGGVKGWATLCGALNGAAAAIQLLSPDPDPLINALFEWYEHAPLPDVHPKGAKYEEIRSVAGSPLCHQSIANWTKVSHKHAYTPERSERCGSLSASVARQTAILLNDQAAGKKVAFALPKQTQSCMTCHEKGGAVENIRTKMDCGGCHAPLMGKHPGKA